METSGAWDADAFAKRIVSQLLPAFADALDQARPPPRALRARAGAAAPRRPPLSRAGLTDDMNTWHLCHLEYTAFLSSLTAARG